MIYDRKPETERLIKFLTEDTEIRIIEYAELIKAASSTRCKTVNDIWGYLSSARRLMRAKHRVKYGTVRGVGITRMNDNEIGFYGNKRNRRAGNQYREGLKDNSLVAGSNSLSPEARATVLVNNVIFTKHLHELTSTKKMIKVAIEDGAAAVAAILAVLNRDDRDMAKH